MAFFSDVSAVEVPVLPEFVVPISDAVEVLVGSGW